MRCSLLWAVSCSYNLLDGSLTVGWRGERPSHSQDGGVWLVDSLPTQGRHHIKWFGRRALERRCCFLCLSCWLWQKHTKGTPTCFCTSRCSLPHLPLQPGLSLLLWMKTARMVHGNEKPESKLLRGAVMGDVSGFNQWGCCSLNLDWKILNQQRGCGRSAGCSN